jgi:hypothetical protein
MGLVPNRSLSLSRATLYWAHNLVRSGTDCLLVATDKSLAIYSPELQELSRIQMRAPITDVGSCDGWVFVTCDQQLFFGRLERGALEPLDVAIWGDVADQFTIQGNHLWYVSRDPEVFSFDLVKRSISGSFPLDSSWTGGSFAIWPGPDMVAVEVPMDCKLGVASCAPSRHFRELPSESYALGFSGANLVSIGDSLFVRAMPSGQIIREVKVDVPFQAMACVRSDTLLFGAGGAYRLGDDALEEIDFPDRNDRTIHQAIALGDQVALVLEDGTLLLCSIA